MSGTSGTGAQLKQVIASGGAPNRIQAPSPVFCSQFLDTSHVLLGAGGGGSRFGMENMLALARVDTSRRGPCSSSGSGGSSSSSHRGAADTSKAPPAAASSLPPLWELVDYVDLRDNIPWCCTPMLPFDPVVDAADWPSERRTALMERSSDDDGTSESRLIGFVAVSGVRSFTLVSVHRHRSAGASACRGTNADYFLRLHRRAVIPLPADEKNPDKKPISLIRHAVVVGHDMGAVEVYPLAMLCTPKADAHCSEEGSGGFPITTSAVPLAVWQLGHRVNDLHANCMDMMVLTRTPVVEAGEDTKTTDTAHLLDYVVVAALSQDKTIRVATYRWRGPCESDKKKKKKKKKKSLNAKKVAEEEEEEVEGGTCDHHGAPSCTPIVEQFALSGKEVGLDFTIMRSSLRLVRLFGTENIPHPRQMVARQDRIEERFALMRLRRQQEQAIMPPPVTTSIERVEQRDAVGMLLVAYDLHKNCSYFVEAQLDAALAPGEPLDPAVTSESKYGALRLALRCVRPPSKVVEGDTISFFAPFSTRQEEGVDNENDQESWRRESTRRKKLYSISSSSNGGGTQDITAAGASTSSSTSASATPTPAGGGRQRQVKSATARKRQREVEQWRQRDLLGSFIPREWIASTVEGRVVMIRDQIVPLSAAAGSIAAGPPPRPTPNASPAHVSSGGTAVPPVVSEASVSAFCQVAARPPTGSRTLAKLFPALHDNPITCVAVSKRNDVVTTDIAQTIVITAMPAPQPVSGKKLSTTAKGGAPCVKCDEIALFPPDDGFQRAMCYVRYWYRTVLILLAMVVALLSTLFLYFTR